MDSKHSSNFREYLFSPSLSNINREKSAIDQCELAFAFFGGYVFMHLCDASIQHFAIPLLIGFQMSFPTDIR